MKFHYNIRNFPDYGFYNTLKMAKFMRLQNSLTKLSSNYLINSNNKLILTSVRSFGSLIKKSDDTQLKELGFRDTQTTHTGQCFEENDKRLTRFVGKEKQINERFAINLIAEVPPKKCDKRVVSCDGGDGPLGHPIVFINLDEPGNHSCGYCGLRFYHERTHH